MSDEDLEVLVTLDDPWYGPDEDIFHHLEPVTYWPGQPFSINAQHNDEPRSRLSLSTSH